jgi:hypothetical protein
MEGKGIVLYHVILLLTDTFFDLQIELALIIRDVYGFLIIK